VPNSDRPPKARRLAPPRSALEAPAEAAGIRREVTCSAKRRIDNAVDRKVSGSRVFSAAAAAAVIVGVAEVIVSEAKANGNGVVVVDDDKNLNSDGG